VFGLPVNLVPRSLADSLYSTHTVPESGARRYVFRLSDSMKMLLAGNNRGRQEMSITEDCCAQVTLYLRGLDSLIVPA
jgi:hypothetical protein